MLTKQKLIYQIKHHPFVRAAYQALGSSALTTMGRFEELDENLVLIVANTGKSFSGSPYAIFQYMQAHEEYDKYHIVWAFNHPEYFQGEFLNVVMMDSPEYVRTALRAKYWITDNNIERSLKFKNPGTRYLNTWHGVALKTIGNDDKFSGSFDYSDIDFLCVSCEHDKRVYKTALNASPECFLECGMPRNDSLFGVSEADRFDIRMKLDIPVDKKVILFAPTWRDSVNGGDSFDLEIPVNFKKWREELGEDYMIMFRAHDRTSKLMNVEFDDFVVNYSTYENLNDLLIAADILVTDYSSICFDWSILEKPFICFGYDWEEYKAERGVYFDANEVYYGGVLKTEEEVIHRIQTMNWPEEVEGVRKLKEEFMTYSKGNAAEICVKALFGDASQESEK